MKIKEAWHAYSAQLDVLRDQRKALSQLLKTAETSGAGQPDFDRVELTRQLSSVDAQIEEVFNGREEIISTWGAVADGEAAKQQGEAMAKWGKDLVKILEIYRRIASGAKVPGKDEQKLMDYDFKLYMVAKQAALMAESSEEEYDSLWDEEEKNAGEEASPAEIADETEIAVASPETVAADAMEAME